MEYRRFNNTIVARIDKGEEILSQIKEIALKENIKLANVNALGATNNFVVGVFKTAEKNKGLLYFRKSTGVPALINKQNAQICSKL